MHSSTTLLPQQGIDSTSGTNLRNSRNKQNADRKNLRPLTHDQGLCPGPRWSLRPQTSVI